MRSSKLHSDRKYLLVIDQIKTGGAERILTDYYIYLKNHGFSVEIFCLFGPVKPNILSDDIQVHYGVERNSTGLIGKITQQFILFVKLSLLVADLKPEAIFSFLERSNILTILLPVRSKKVISVHNLLSEQYKKIHSSAIKNIFYVLLRLVYNSASKIVAVSEMVKADLINEFKIMPHRVIVVNNYVDKNKILELSRIPVEEYVFDENTAYIMSVGRLSDQKAQWKLLKAFSVLITLNPIPKVRLLLIGEGDLRDNLVELSKNLGIDHLVDILPFHSNPYKFLSKASLFCLSSQFEGFPIVIAEASALRIPFVGSENSIPEEMFSDKVFRRQLIYSPSNTNRDFTRTLYQDEIELAQILKKGIEDKAFRYKILNETRSWEDQNDIDVQFSSYLKLSL